MLLVLKVLIVLILMIFIVMISMILKLMVVMILMGLMVLYNNTSCFVCYYDLRRNSDERLSSTVSQPNYRTSHMLMYLINYIHMARTIRSRRFKHMSELVTSDGDDSYDSDSRTLMFGDSADSDGADRASDSINGYASDATQRFLVFGDDGADQKGETNEKAEGFAQQLLQLRETNPILVQNRGDIDCIRSSASSEHCTINEDCPNSSYVDDDHDCGSGSSASSDVDDIDDYQYLSSFLQNREKGGEKECRERRCEREERGYTRENRKNQTESRRQKREETTETPTI